MPIQTDQHTFAFLDRFAIEAKNPDSNETILRDRDTQQLILMKEIQINAEDYEETMVTLEYQQSLSHQQLVPLLSFYCQPNLNSFIVLYEYCPISLHEQFESRLQQQRSFEQSELWSIFTSLALGLAYLQENNVGHGSVSAYDCYLNENGLIKICDPTTATSNPYIIIKSSQSCQYYYSPQIMRCIIAQTGEQINIFKSDVFSLGCCMLELSLMRGIQSMFDYARGIIHRNVHRQYLAQLESIGYSKEYVSFIKDMLSLNHHHRPDFIAIKIRIFQLLSMDPEQLSEKLMKQSHDIKSSISSLKKSKGQCQNKNECELESVAVEHKKKLIYVEEDAKANYSSCLQFCNDGDDRKKHLSNKENSVLSNQQIYKLSDICKFKTCQTELSQSNQSIRSYAHTRIVPITGEPLYVRCVQNYVPVPVDQELVVDNGQRMDNEHHKHNGSRGSLHNLPSKERRSQKLFEASQKRQSRPSQPSQNQAQLYTNPDFLKMMQNDVQQILSKRNLRL